MDACAGLSALPGVVSPCWTHRPRLRERLHQFYPLGVDLDEGQQVPGLNRLEQLDHLGRGRRAGLPCVLVVNVLGVYELLPHRPVQEESSSASLSELVHRPIVLYWPPLLTCRWMERALVKGRAGFPP